ncbi:chlorohydrolase [Streptococcus pneumoniae]|uniref:Chlorohydrolase n=1 Tax=Streptococcus pneumoniae TaxID=1313 RepID=A0AA95D665_STREE|nr:chlorohydrolase [Streptococcus pneumoniae]CJP76951.1 chlorohydrolase [Streptococcus pneumoniae]CJQ91936.1 chlorohydrolase [Streptococcus pneumoniae]CJT62240.1 chlorohydrolase [Streptococcus pneumoniae]CKG37437.1 chlorohydrolase [Streptococcus pneumoniae]
MKIKEETSKLVADCQKHRFEVVGKTDVYNPR